MTDDTFTRVADTLQNYAEQLDSSLSDDEIKRIVYYSYCLWLEFSDGICDGMTESRYVGNHFHHYGYRASKEIIKLLKRGLENVKRTSQHYRHYRSYRIGVYGALLAEVVDWLKADKRYIKPQKTKVEVTDGNEQK